MKHLTQLILLTVFCFSGSLALTAQRASPQKTTTGIIDGVNILVQYGSPSVKGRKIWGGLVPYGEVWRTGANEMSFFQNHRTIKVQGVELPEGKYGIYTIPGEKSWKVAFSKTWDIWGSSIEPSEDDIVVECPFVDSGRMEERMIFEIDDEKNEVRLLWEEKMVVMDIAVE